MSWFTADTEKVFLDAGQALFKLIIRKTKGEDMT